VDGKWAVNTIQPLMAPFSPGTPTAKRLLINNTDPSKPGYTQNIGNRLDDAGINWRWYSGGWNDADPVVRAVSSAKASNSSPDRLTTRTPAALRVSWPSP
jgi:hypothetical protein